MVGGFAYAEHIHPLTPAHEHLIICSCPFPFMSPWRCLGPCFLTVIHQVLVAVIDKKTGKRIQTRPR